MQTYTHLSYSFDKATKQVTITWFSGSIEQIKLITDLTTTTPTVIYDPTRNGYGWTLAGSVLTLTYNTNTASFANTDKLEIIIDPAVTTQPVSIASMPSTPVTGTFWQATQPVSWPLTDTQLRATPVPVSGTVTTWGLTDTQLRASAVPVSLATNTPTIQAGSAIIGKVGIDQTTPWTTNKVDIWTNGTVTINALTNSSIIKAQFQDNAGTAITVGQKAMTSSVPVVIASDQASIPVASTLTAETTKVIGVTRTADGAGNLLTSNSTTYTAKFWQDVNVLGTLWTAFSTAGKVDVKWADGDVFVRQATGTNLHTVVDSGTITTVSTLTNQTQMWGANISMGTGVRDAGTQRVTIATNDVVPITDNSGSLTVDAPVWTPVFVRLSDGSSAIATLPVSIAATVVTKETRSSTPSQTSPSVTTSSTSILASNANRLWATIYNEAWSTCLVKLWTTASATSYSVQIAVWGYYEIPFQYTWAIDGIVASWTATLRVTELT